MFTLFKTVGSCHRTVRRMKKIRIKSLDLLKNQDLDIRETFTVESANLILKRGLSSILLYYFALV